MSASIDSEIDSSRWCEIEISIAHNKKCQRSHCDELILSE